MAGGKKIDLVKAVAFGALVVSLVLIIVGICLDWVVYETSNALTGKITSKYALGSEYITDFDGYGAMAAFAYITLALAAVAVVLVVVNYFLKNKIVNFCILGVSALIVVSGIVCLALTYSFSAKIFLEIGYVPAAGPWLVFVFAVIGGAAGVVGSLKK
jgi:hypothetical protein